MRVRLRGLNRVRKRLADGTFRTYWYAWKGGPALTGEPGSPEFVAAYNAAVARKMVAPEGLLQSILGAYQTGTEFLSLADRTRADYQQQIKRIEAEFSDLPLSVLSDRRTRAEFMAWRDKLAKNSHRQADYAWTVLARVLSWAMNRGLVTKNPCEKGGRLYHGSRADKVWTDEDEEAFYRSAPTHIHLALTLALWTGQRQGDLLRLTWSAYDGKTIRLRQSKTSTRVVIPVGNPLRTALDAAKKLSPVVLVNKSGKPWTPDGFRVVWRKACKRAGVSGVTFNDLRGTAVTRLALAGATEAEIATLTGHSLRDVRSILDSHYLNRDPALAVNAVAKLESRTKSPN